MLRSPRFLAALVLVASILVPTASAHAAAPVLSAKASPRLYEPRMVTGDVNTPAVEVGNPTARIVHGNATILVPTRARLLGVLVNPTAAGSAFRVPTCTTTSVASGVEVHCPILLAPRQHVLVIAVTGAAAPGVATLAFSAAATGSTSTGTARTTYRATGPTCTILGTNGAFAGTGAPEALTGTDGADVICGFGGQDVCHGNFLTRASCTAYEADTIRAGAGDDLVLLPAVNSVRHATRGDDVDLGDGIDTLVNADSFGSDAGAVLGADGWLAQRHGGTRVRHAVRSAEAYVGGPGADTVIGTDGADTINGGGGDDDLSGGGGDDLLLGGAGDDFLHGGAGVDRLDGGAGTFDAAGAGTTTGSTVDLMAGTIQAGGEVDSLAGIEGAIGTPGADVLVGTAKTNAFYGTPGTDTVIGGGGVDVISFEQLGVGVTIDATAHTVVAGAWKTSFSGIESFVGSAKADRFRGTDDVDVFDGAGGNDLADGLGGDDVLSGGPGNDTLRGGAGRDELTGDAGRDVLFGGPERDRCRQDARSYLTDC